MEGLSLRVFDNGKSCSIASYLATSHAPLRLISQQVMLHCVLSRNKSCSIASYLATSHAPLRLISQQVMLHCVLSRNNSCSIASYLATMYNVCALEKSLKVTPLHLQSKLPRSTQPAGPGAILD